MSLSDETQSPQGVSHTRRQTERRVIFFWPPKYVKRPDFNASMWHLLPRKYRWFWWLWDCGGGSVGNIDGKTNRVRHLVIFRRHILTWHIDEYHDRSDAERAEEYLRKWSECERELHALKIQVIGYSTDPATKALLREIFGVDFDSGEVL